MANQPDVPAHLYRALNERPRNSDKESEIELYYELLSSGRSVGEILNGVGPVPGKPRNGGAATAEYPRSGPDAAASAVASEAAPAGAAQANPRATGGPSAFEAESSGTAKARASERAPLDDPGTGNREQLRRENSPEPEPDGVVPARADAFNGRKATTHTADRERLWSGRFPGIAKSIAFWALYTGAVASVSIAGFSLVRGDHATEPGIARAQPNPSGESGTNAAAMPGAAAGRRETVAASLEPEKPVVRADASPVSETSQPGEPVSAVPEPAEPISVGVRKTAPAVPREAEAPQDSHADRPDALEQLIEQLTVPAAARDAAPEPVPPVAQSLSIPTGAADAAPHRDAGQPEGNGKLGAAPEGDATASLAAPASMPDGSASAASPSGAQDAGRRQARTPRRSAEASRNVRRRTAARHSQPRHAGQGAGSYHPNQGAASYFPDAARGYGQGTFGPAPYSDSGD
jgi:hypothetical protein